MKKAKALSPKVVGSAFSVSLHGLAADLLRRGDESLYRALTVGSTRFTVQCMSVEPDEFGKSRSALGRKRKFSNPLFITPKGLVHAFPQSDEDMFVNVDTAQEAMKIHGGNRFWQISSTTLASLMKTKAFQRWRLEVESLPEGVGYVEPRRSLEDTFAIYSKDGIAGLRRHYTKSHAFHLIAKYKEQGLIT